MSARPLLFDRLGERAGRLGARFNAWWEGYDFAPPPSVDAAPKDPAIFIPECIWGPGRTEPGEPAWTLRHARTLGLPARASVTVFGAEAGAPLRDLAAGTRWKLSGLTRAETGVRGLDLKTYDAAMVRLARTEGEGAICFFELHRDADPAAFARFAADHVRPGAPIAFVDFALARKGQRPRDCFPEIAPGSPRLAADYVRALKEAGLSSADAVDESRVFVPLIVRGWSRWRRAYDAARAATPPRAAADAVRFLADYARLWAERLDALKSGSLTVVRLLARRG